MPANTTGRGHEWQRLCARAKRELPWICHLCGQPIERKPARHGDRWTLDHLDAIATTGTALPTLDRTAPAHHSCNSKRGARTPEPSWRSRVW